MKETRDGVRKVVIAEQDEEVRHLLSEFLKLQGFLVEELARPGGLCEGVFEDTPDLFLLGHGVSEEETFEALDSVRDQQDLESVPVIVIAVDPDEGFLTKVVSRGADMLLPFPFPMEVLQERIETPFTEDGPPSCPEIASHWSLVTDHSRRAESKVESPRSKVEGWELETRSSKRIIPLPLPGACKPPPPRRRTP